jgi:hypothetical protein
VQAMYLPLVHFDQGTSRTALYHRSTRNEPTCGVHRVRARPIRTDRASLQADQLVPRVAASYPPTGPHVSSNSYRPSSGRLAKGLAAHPGYSRDSSLATLPEHCGEVRAAILVGVVAGSAGRLTLRMLCGGLEVSRWVPAGLQNRGKE